MKSENLFQHKSVSLQEIMTPKLRLKVNYYTKAKEDQHP